MTSAPDRRPDQGLRWTLPIFRSLDGYRRSWLVRDLIAGSLIAAVAIPLSMGMAEVAGLPPIVGLYSCVLPLVAFAVFGSSRQVVVALDASTAAMLAAAVTPLANGNATTYAALAGLVAVLVGVILIAAGIFRLGVLGDLLSHPVLLGYQAGLAIVVAATQLPKVLGVDASGGGTVAQMWGLVRNVGQADLSTVTLGFASVAVIVGARAWSVRVPGALIAVGLATVAARVFDLSGHGVQVLGELPAGLSGLTWPSFTGSELVSVTVPAAGIALIAAADTIVCSRAFAERGGYRVETNGDLIGLGGANLASGLSGGISVSASAARTAVAESVGSRSQVAGVVAATVMAGVLMFLTDPLQDVPIATLAAVVLVAVIRLVDVRAMAALWRIRRSELLIALATTTGAVVIGLLEGIAIAVMLSVVDFLLRRAAPHGAVIGRISGRQGFFDVDRYPGAIVEPGLVVYRLDGPLFYANAERVLESVRQLVADPGVRWFVLDGSAVSDVDATAARMLAELHDELAARGIELALVDLIAGVRDTLERAGVIQRVGPHHVFDTAEDAVDAYRASTG
ncbi:MAG TPA: SulP family inorganic anion transporter [Actinomycetota bacterium]